MQWAQLAIAFMGEEKASKLSQQQLELLGKQLAQLQGIELPDLPEIAPEQLGESAVAGLQSDEGLRSNQLQAIAELQNIVDAGGLDLSDKVSLEQALDVARNQQRRARAGVTGDLAGRGQLDAGARMVMGLDAAQAGANELRRTGMETAAMAQRRRLDAIRAAADASGGLREQDWREKESPARAKDLRDELNAAARQKATLYNAGIPQQQFNNAVTKVTGQQTGVNNMAQGLGAAATDARASAAGMAGVVGSMNQPAYGDGGGSYQYSSDSNQYAKRGGAQDISKGDDEK